MVRERWLSKRAIFLHVSVLIFVPACALAAWWQITRAQDGNGLSYLYSVEWPVFAILAAYFWWMLIHTDYDTVGLKGMQNEAALAATEIEPTTESAAMVPVPSQARHDVVVDDPELAAYNARLAQLSEQGPKTWRSPETHVARRST